jgi:hypothetical protein
MIFFEPLYLLFLAPAIVLGLWAQARVRSAISAGQKAGAPISGR